MKPFNKDKEMKKDVYSIMIGILLVPLSCSKEMDPMPAEGGGFKVELTGGIGRTGTRLSETEDPEHGLRTCWDEGDAVKVLFYGEAPCLAELVSPEGDGHFSGEVESGSDATAFYGSDLYCVNISSRISTVLDGGTMKCTVDFSGQDGSLENVADYELMFVKGRASKRLHFEHQTSVLRFTFDGLEGYWLEEASFSFTPSDGSDGQFLFAGSAVYSIGEEGIGVSTDDVTFYEMKDLDITIEEGRAVVYLVVPARCCLKGELSIFLKTDDCSYRRYVRLGGKSFKASYVVARGETLTADDLVPEIGDYVYSDGSWGPLVYYDDKWPQAVIFSNYTSPSDRAAGYVHGYAMALRDAAWPTAWAPESEVEIHPDYPETANVFESVSGSAALQMMGNLDGLTTCRILDGLYLNNFAQGNYYGMTGFEHTGQRAAIPCAMRYGEEDWVMAYSGTSNIHAFDAPPGTSGWFLPSLGQWYLCLSNLGGIDPDKLVMAADGDNVSELAWKFSSSAERQGYLDAFTRYFSSNQNYNPVLGEYEVSGRMVATAFYLPYSGQLDWYLWGCDEGTADGTATVVYLDSTDIVFKYVSKQTGNDSDNGYAARSVLAF